jgi:hypothetical protein
VNWAQRSVAESTMRVRGIASITARRRRWPAPIAAKRERRDLVAAVSGQAGNAIRDDGHGASQFVAW